jgi:hypothetical protein
MNLFVRVVINPPGSRLVPAKVIALIEVTGYYDVNLRKSAGQRGTSVRYPVSHRELEL